MYFNRKRDFEALSSVIIFYIYNPNTLDAICVSKSRALKALSLIYPLLEVDLSAFFPNTIS